MKNLQKHMLDNGIPCEQEIVLDGKIHRYSYKGSKSDVPEWYVGFVLDSGGIYCTYGSWRTDQKYLYTSHESISQADKDQITKKQEEIEIEWHKKHAEAAKLASKIFSECDSSQGHPYLKRKQIKGIGTKSKNGSLYLPLSDTKGNIQSLQKISEDGTKQFMPGGKCKSHFMLIGNAESGSSIYVAEGYATASSIFEATGACVAVAFSCHNLTVVGYLLEEAYPQKRIILCADNGNAGDKSVIKWKEYLNDHVYQPKFYGKGTEKDKDFNDLSVLLGKDEVKKQLRPSIKNVSLYSLLNDSSKVDWLVPNLLIRGSVNMIYGPGAAGKSAVCHSLAFACSQGIPFWYYEPKKCKVGYIDGELSHSENKSRWESILRRTNVEEIDESAISFITPESVFSTFDNPIDLYSKEWQERLDPFIEANDLIFLDNISTLTGDNGDADYENKASSWVNVGAWLRKWKSKGKSFMVVHHANKSGGFRGTSRMSVDTMTQIKLDPIEIKDERIEIHVKVVFEKRREISGKWKFPFEAILEENQWKLQAVSKEVSPSMRRNIY